jgi:putative hydrolase of the HAD superfamily
MSRETVSDDRPTIIFDLGNVILPFDHISVSRKIAEMYGLEHGFVHKALYNWEFLKPFEEGRITPEEFLERCSQQLGVTLEPAWFKETWCDMFRENAAVIEMIEELRQSYRLVLLSNASAWHIDHIRERYSVLDFFDDHVYSFETGCMKPDRAIFERAVELSSGSGPVAYIDDVEAFVIAARELGIPGVHFQSAEQLRAELETMGIL